MVYKFIPGITSSQVSRSRLCKIAVTEQCPRGKGGHCVLGDLQCCRHFLVPLPRSLPRHNPVSELYGQFLFALTCTVNFGTLYRQVCAFPNHVQSIEFSTGGLQSSCRNISRMVNGTGSSILSLIAKSLNTYVNKVFLFFYFEYICKNV